VANSGLIQNRAATLRFLESQLAYDQRLLKATQDRAENIRQTLSVYANDQRSAAAETAAALPKEPRPQVQRPDTVTPQITESFLDRLVSLTTQSSDAVYRQKLANEYRVASQAIVPVQQAVSYDQDVLTVVKSGGAAASADAASVRGEIAGTQSEVKQLVGRVNEIYRSISNNLSPSKELYTPTAPPVARTEHSRSLSQLALYGVALLALSLPLTTIFCLIHARIREEDATEAYLAATAA
jgi:hypothetical protein